LTLYRDPQSGQLRQRTSLGQEIEPSYWKTGFTYLYTGVMGSNSYHYAVEQVAFFADVQASDGQVVRLWQSRHGANYSWDDAFALPTTTKYIAYGNIQYAAAAAAIFESKFACHP
jgi:hypothetical protein